MHYGPDLPGSFRRVAVYVDKILKGAQPADLPVEQPTQFELAINRKTAQALGLTIPSVLLFQAKQGDPIGGGRGTERVVNRRAGSTTTVSRFVPPSVPL